LVTQQSADTTAPSDWLSRMITPFCPPVVAGEDEEQRRQYRAVVTFVFVGVTIVFGFARLNVKLGNDLAAAVQFVMVAAAVSSLLLLRRGYVRTTAHMSLVITSITIAIGMWTGGGMAAAATVFLPAIPVVGLLTVGRGGGITGAAQAIGIVVVIATLEKLGFEPRQDPADKLFVKRVAESIVVVLEIWLFCGIFFRFKHEAFALLARNRDELAELFDSMGQGVVAFGADGIVTGRHSAQARKVFARDSLEGMSILDLLYGEHPEYDLNREELRVWLEAVFQAKDDEVGEVLSFAPQQCVRGEGTSGEQHLRLEFRPLLTGGRLTRMMLLATDDTERVRLRREADEEKAARELALSKLRRAAAGGARPLIDFMRHADERLLEFDKHLTSGAGPADIERLLRSAHTIRGEARVLDLDDLSGLSARIEDGLVAIRNDLSAGKALNPTVLETVQKDVAGAKQAVIDAREALVALSPIGAAILDQVTVSQVDLQRLWQRLESVGAADATGPINDVAMRLLSRPFGEAADNLFEAAQRWAEQEGKRAGVQILGREVRVPPALGEVLPGVLTHLVRNAVAHGIETSEQREQLRKPRAGSITVRCEDGPGGPVVRVEDDGQGIDFEVLAARAKEKGLSLRHNEPHELLFVDGLSSAADVTGLRGRGVGLCAVRADLAHAGYEVRVTSSPQKGACFTIEPARARATAAE